MENGVLGNLGVHAILIGGLDLDDVTTHHLHMEVLHVLALHIRRKVHVVQVIFISHCPFDNSLLVLGEPYLSYRLYNITKQAKHLRIAL